MKTLITFKNVCEYLFFFYLVAVICFCIYRESSLMLSDCSRNKFMYFGSLSFRQAVMPVTQVCIFDIVLESCL